MIWMTGVPMVAEPKQAQYAGALTGEPLDPYEVAKARKLEVGDFRQMGVSLNVPVREARDGGHQVLGVRGVDVKHAD